MPSLERRTRRTARIVSGGEFRVESHRSKRRLIFLDYDREYGDGMKKEPPTSTVQTEASFATSPAI